MVIFSAVVLLALGARYAGDSEARWLDDAARDVVGEWSPLPWGASGPLISLADPVPLAVIIALLAGLCLALNRRRLALLAVAGPVLTGLATVVLKPIFRRTEDGGEFVYPSGHMGAATAVTLVAALLLVSLTAVGLWAAVAIVASLTLLVGATMAVAMLTLNYHYLTDALGGFCTAVSVVLGLALLVEGRARATSRPV